MPVVTFVLRHRFKLYGAWAAYAAAKYMSDKRVKA